MTKNDELFQTQFLDHVKDHDESETEGESWTTMESCKVLNLQELLLVDPLLEWISNTQGPIDEVSCTDNKRKSWAAELPVSDICQRLGPIEHLFFNCAHERPHEILLLPTGTHWNQPQFSESILRD